MVFWDRDRRGGFGTEPLSPFLTVPQAKGPSKLSEYSETGTVYGVAWNPVTRQLFSSAHAQRTTMACAAIG